MTSFARGTLEHWFLEARVYYMFASWKVKQLAAGCDDEQEVIVTITRQEIEQSQQRRDLRYRPCHDVPLLYQLYSLLFNGLIQESVFDRNGNEGC